MLGIDARAAKAAWTVGLVAVAFYATYLVRKTLLVFVLALFLMPPAIVAATGGTPPGRWDPDVGWHEAHSASGLR